MTGFCPPPQLTSCSNIIFCHVFFPVSIFPSLISWWNLCKNRYCYSIKIGMRTLCAYYMKQFHKTFFSYTVFKMVFRQKQHFKGFLLFQVFLHFQLFFFYFFKCDCNQMFYTAPFCKTPQPSIPPHPSVPSAEQRPCPQPAMCPSPLLRGRVVPSGETNPGNPRQTLKYQKW